MPRSNVVPLHAKRVHLPICEVPPPEAPMPSLDEQVKSVPAYLELAIDLILIDFNYNAHLDANTAKAVRVLAIMANRISKALENNHV